MKRKAEGKKKGAKNSKSVGRKTNKEGRTGSSQTAYPSKAIAFEKKRGQGRVGTPEWLLVTGDKSPGNLRKKRRREGA